MLANYSVESFLQQLSSKAPAPGGGSAAALTGALAGALTAMVCNLTSGPNYDNVKEQVVAVLQQAEKLTAELQSAMDKDAAAFSAVMAAYQMPKAADGGKEKRQEIIQATLQEACIVPMHIADLSMAVLKLAEEILAIGNRHAVSDAAIAGVLAYAGVQSALYNVKINIVSIKDAEFEQEMKSKMAVLPQQAEEVYREILTSADQAIGV